MDYNRDSCPIFKAVSEIGDRWMLLIYRELIIGNKRFDEFQSILKISKSVLTDKLNKMLERDLIEKVPYKEENERRRYQYQLTKKGKDLFKVMVAMLEWGNKYLVPEGVSTLTIVDKFEGAPIKLKVLDQENELIRWRNTKMVITKNKEVTTS